LKLCVPPRHVLLATVPQLNLDQMAFGLVRLPHHRSMTLTTQATTNVYPKPTATRGAVWAAPLMSTAHR
jgi:hypothetical protein